MKNLKKVLVLCLSLAMVGGVLAGCGSSSDGESSDAAITVVSREDGSGTRGAFIELTGVEAKDADGNKVDNTVETAEITNSTSVMMQTVAGNKDAIGYISLGSLDDTVKAVKVDGVEATAENVKSGDYKLARPFNIVTRDGDISEAAADFIAYIMSEEGQTIVEGEGYVSEGNEGAFAGGNVSGKIVVAGSSSVTPVMQKLAEEYQKVNTNVEIEVQQSDSSTGVSSTVEGVCDIGMASRELKDEETTQGITAQAIALDGIAVIVNSSTALSVLTITAIPSNAIACAVIP